MKYGVAVTDISKLKPIVKQKQRQKLKKPCRKIEFCITKQKQKSARSKDIFEERRVIL